MIDRCAVFAAKISKASDVAEERHDRSTEDLFTELSRVADKQLWFLEAHVQHYFSQSSEASTAVR